MKVKHVTTVHADGWRRNLVVVDPPVHLKPLDLHLHDVDDQRAVQDAVAGHYLVGKLELVAAWTRPPQIFKVNIDVVNKLQRSAACCTSECNPTTSLRERKLKYGV